MNQELVRAIQITVTIVLGYLFLGFFITTIVLATSRSDTYSSSAPEPPKPPEPPEPTFAVSFTEFTAEKVIYSYYKEAPSNNRKELESKEVVFNEYKWFQEQYYEGEIFYRQFSTDDDDSVIQCFDMSSHGNCYRTTSGSTGGFQIPNEVQIKIKGESCYELYPELQNLLPSRVLGKCDYYGAVFIDEGLISFGDTFMYWLVESETNYPVLLQVKKLEEGSSTMILYKSFKPGKPQDESGLQPFPGVRVYDFREGEGDVEDREVNNHAMLKNISKQSKTNRKTPNEVLNIPLLHVAPITRSRVRDAVVRDVSSIPAQFDARTYWPSCSDIIGTITNQDICGSCWAMASAGVFSDRLCISQGVKVQLSPQYLVYCGKHSNGCQGGLTITAWDDLIDQGTVSESCIPFTGRFGECPSDCKDYSIIDDENKYYPTGYVFPWGNTDEARVQAIQSEIMTRGPVLASFLAFDDFQSFFDENPEAVYHRSRDASDGGGHAVRIIGWGTTDEGEDYWLVANSWGKDWADDGVFRIRRGTNECNIEEQVGGLICD